MNNAQRIVEHCTAKIRYKSRSRLKELRSDIRATHSNYSTVTSEAEWLGRILRSYSSQLNEYTFDFIGLTRKKIKQVFSDNLSLPVSTSIFQFVCMPIERPTHTKRSSKLINNSLSFFNDGDSPAGVAEGTTGGVVAGGINDLPKYCKKFADSLSLHCAEYNHDIAKITPISMRTICPTVVVNLICKR